MIFRETKLKGSFVIEGERYEDERGYFSPIWSAHQFEAHGLVPSVAECNVSFNSKKGTLRGMHFQNQPFAQAKLVRCARGAVYDVALDLRPESETFKQWIAVNLTANNSLMFYIPKGFAHGFQTLEDESEVVYQMSDVYNPEAAGGVRWNDPTFGIKWPDAERIIIARDRDYPDFPCVTQLNNPILNRNSCCTYQKDR
jgi:dTDP-4-dehydrorhamnose 3,5-epimerase